jgi:hypothetical protein
MTTNKRRNRHEREERGRSHPQGQRFINLDHITRCSPDNIAAILNALSEATSRAETLERERDEARNKEWQAAISALQLFQGNWPQDCKSQSERDAIRRAADDMIAELKASGPTEYLDITWKDAKHAVAMEARATKAEAERDAAVAALKDIRTAVEAIHRPRTEKDPT